MFNTNTLASAAHSDRARRLWLFGLLMILWFAVGPWLHPYHVILYAGIIMIAGMIWSRQNSRINFWVMTGLATAA